MSVPSSTALALFEPADSSKGFHAFHSQLAAVWSTLPSAPRRVERIVDNDASLHGAPAGRTGQCQPPHRASHAQSSQGTLPQAVSCALHPSRSLSASATHVDC